MSYRTLLVRGGSDRPSQDRVFLAFGLAELFDAVVLGVGADSAAAHAFRAGAAKHDCQSHWRTDAGGPTRSVLDAASCADLIVAGPAPDEHAPDPAGLILRASQPVLLAPKGVDRLYPRTAAIGWKNTISARRAITDAIPLLQKCERTLLIGVCEYEGAVSIKAEMEAVADRLARRGIRCDAITAPQLQVSAADDLINAAQCRDADFLVAGAFGQSRWRERVFGGVTRDLLSEIAMPILFSG